MLKIGITGNIGSGKTTVSKVFEVLGVPVFYADAEAKKVMTEDTELITAIKQAFGPESYLNNGQLNRPHIAAIVFNNDAELARLNAIVHPATFRAFRQWVAGFTDAKAVPYVLKEAALLFESDSWKMCDDTIMVTAPLQTRVNRVTLRDGTTPEQVMSRELKQMPEAEKIKLAGHTIKNDDTELVIPQVLALHQQFTAIAASR